MECHIWYNLSLETKINLRKKGLIRNLMYAVSAVSNLYCAVVGTEGMA